MCQPLHILADAGHRLPSLLGQTSTDASKSSDFLEIADHDENGLTTYSPTKSLDSALVVVAAFREGAPTAMDAVS